MNIVELGDIPTDNIEFADPEVKRLCVENWDIDGDGELNYFEASLVEDLGEVFMRTRITQFDELQFFTSLTSIGNNAFSQCIDLTSIIIPESVTNIGWKAFANCLGLISIDIPDGLISIGEGAVAGCRALTSITIPSSVTSIGEAAFAGCESLTEIRSYIVNPFDLRTYCWERVNKTIPLYVPIGTKAKYEATAGWKEFMNIVEMNDPIVRINAMKQELDDQALNCEKYLTDQKAVLEQKDPEHKAEDIWEGLTTQMKNVNIFRDQVKNATTEEQLTQLKLVLEDITKRSRYVGSLIDEYEPPKPFTATTVEGVELILKIISEEDKTVQIGDGEKPAISSSATGSVTIPATVGDYKVVAIAKQAFNDCRGLEAIHIPASVTSLAENFLGNCRNLTSLTVDADNPVYNSPANSNAIIKTENRMLIAACNSTVLPEGILTIGNYAFAYCDAIETLDLPDGVYDFDDFAFGYSSIRLIATGNINQIRFSVGAFNWSKVEAFYLRLADGTLEMICNGATFCWAIMPDWTFPSFKTYVVPETVSIGGKEYTLSKLGKSSFSSSSFPVFMMFTDLTIPATIKAIGGYAFNGCTAIRTITSYIKEPFTIENNVFAPEVYAEATLYVPAGTKALYEATEGWKNFANIVEMSGDPVTTYTLSYIVDGEVYKTFTLNEGEDIIPDAAPATKLGYRFSGWSEIPATMPDHDVTVTGTFTEIIPIEGTRKWDFTKWSDATVANLKADAAASKVYGWSDVEKQAAAEADEEPTDISRDNCFWSAGEANPDGSMSANGVVIDELKGLVFNNSYALRRSLAIAVNYPFAANDYAGPSYLWLGGGKRQLPCFTIPGVAAGSTITIEVESHKASEERGIELYWGWDADGLVDAAMMIGDSFTTTTKESHTWFIENTCDVTVYNTNGCHIYSIVVAPQIETTPGDITGTGVVEDEDVDAFIELYLDDEIPEEGDADFSRFDANGDGIISLADAVAIFYLSNGLNFDGTDPNAARASEPMDNGQRIMDNDYEVTVEATELGNGIVRYTLTSDFEYAGFAIDVKGAQVVGEWAEGMTLRSADTKGKHRIVAYNFGQAAAAGTVLTLDVLVEAEFSNINFSDANARNIRFRLSETTGIGATLMDNGKWIINHYYDLQGRASESLKKGVNILRHANGKTKKVSVK